MANEAPAFLVGGGPAPGIERVSVALAGGN
jgi:hypothetical protein